MENITGVLSHTVYYLILSWMIRQFANPSDPGISSICSVVLEWSSVGATELVGTLALDLRTYPLSVPAIRHMLVRRDVSSDFESQSTL